MQSISKEQMRILQNKVLGNSRRMLDFLGNVLASPEYPDHKIPTDYIYELYVIFTQAVEELKFEDREEALSGGHDTINQKLDSLMEQNKAIAEGVIAVSEMVEDLGEKKTQVPKSPQPSFQQPPNFEPQLDQPPIPQQGPVAMPSIPFSDLDEPQKPKKKGLFGRLKK